MEGIMMRGPVDSAMAVRNTQGEIVVEKFPTQAKKRPKIFTLPIIRGLYSYIDSMVTGSKCLMRSAEISGLEEAEEELRREKEAKKVAKVAKKKAKNAEAAEESINDTEAPETKAEDKTLIDSKDKKKDSSSAFVGIAMAFSVIVGLALGIGMFIVLPSLIYGGAAHIFPFLRPENEALRSLIKSVFEGVLKIILIVGYMALISLMKDIKRTFQYHGAEHKTIFCYEKGLELTVDNVREQNKFHPRCGTSFLILMILVSIFISFFIDPLFTLIFGFVPNIAIRILIKILLLPLICGIGYELIKLAGRYDNWFTRIISAPGVWLQHVTVLEPDDSMIECAIAAMKEVIPDDESDKW